MEQESPFDLFWQASELDSFNVQAFASGLNDYDSDQKELNLAYPLAANPLPKARSSINRIAQKRRSQREFGKQPLSVKQISRIMSSFKANDGLEHRSYPSAGATYCTEIYLIPFNLAKPYDKGIYYYDAQQHGLVKVKEKAVKWLDIQPSLNIEVSGIPQAIVLFVSVVDRAVAKYGERGARFALIEAGAAVQQLALQIAASPKLKGVAVGGMYDQQWLQLIGLENRSAKLSLGYLVGQ